MKLPEGLRVGSSPCGGSDQCICLFFFRGLDCLAKGWLGSLSSRPLGESSKQRGGGSSMWVATRRFIGVCAVLVLTCLVVLSGTSYAAGGSDTKPGRKHYACVTARWHTLNLSSKTATCPFGQRKIFFSARGRRGLQGRRGHRGRAGAVGATGATGATGAQGVKGDSGAAGATGATGAQGEQGATGAQGERGDKGET